MKESKNGVLIAIIIILLILLVASIFMIFKSNNVEQEEVSADLTNEMTIREETNTTIENETEENIIADNTIVKKEGITSSKIETSQNTELTNEEKSKIENYLNKVCNWNSGIRLPEFDNINNANKEWIYSHIDREKYEYYISEKELQNELKEMFGKDLIINIKSDITNNNNIIMPKYDIDYKKYSLPAFSGDINFEYCINYISKDSDCYIANIIEYSIQRDMDRNPDIDSAIYSYINNQWEKVFEINENDKENIEKIIKNNNKFQAYNLFLKRDINNNIYVYKIEKS